MISGIVPSMIYYGIQILSPDIFLLASCIICIIVSLATGSSWTTSATIGIALMGVGKSLGVDDGFIAGAVLSGAYFGDTLWKVFGEMFWHRWFHWKRGDGWQD